MIVQKELSEDEKNDWDRFVLEQNGPFLQSWEWGEFQKSIGRRVFFLKGEDPPSSGDFGEASWQALIIKHNLPLGRSYLYCPRGPIFKTRNQKSARPAERSEAGEIRNNSQNQNFQNQNLRDFIKEMKELAKQSSVIFVRIEPTGEISEDILKEVGFIRTKDVQPSKTLVLDLTIGEQEIFDNFHPKTRYNVNLAGRKGVDVRKSEYNEKDFEDFWRLMNETAKRQGIKIFPREYYRKQLNPPHPPFIKGGRGEKWLKNEGNSSLSQREGRRDFENLLFIAEYQGKTIAANLVNFFGQTATYLHGGSDSEYRSFMAPHLLQWEQIKEAKRRSCRIYDFWGIDEINWPGITRFKKGFGGEEVDYIGTFDLILKQAWYSAYILAKKIL